MWASRGGAEAKLLHFVMIKPSHYDDDGYPIQWLRSAIPSNTLACINALAEDARRREVLGPDVEIRLHTYDETNRRVRPDRIIRIEDGVISSEERPKKDGKPPAEHGEHHPAPHAAGAAPNPEPPTQPTGSDKSLRGRFRIRRHG